MTDIFMDVGIILPNFSLAVIMKGGGGVVLPYVDQRGCATDQGTLLETSKTGYTCQPPSQKQGVLFRFFTKRSQGSIR